MSDGNELLKRALAGLVFVAIVVGAPSGIVFLAQSYRPPSDPAGIAGEPETRQNRSESGPTPPLSAIDTKKGDDRFAVEKKTTPDPNKYANADLVEQRRMADATEELTDLTWWQIRIGTVETFLLLITVGLTFWAVLITRNTARRELRAYVGPMSAYVEMGEDGSIGYGIKYMNYGETPALNMVPQTTLVIKEHPLKESLVPVSSPPPGQRVTKGIIWPGVHVEREGSADEAISAEICQEITNGISAIFLYGKIDYQDVFMRHHVTTFRLMYTGLWGGRKTLEICNEGNNAT